MLVSILLRCGLRLGFCPGSCWNNRRDLVFLNENISKVGLDLEHVVLVGDDHAVKLFAVFEANLIRPGGERHPREGQRNCRQQKWAARMGDSHRESIPPPRLRRNFHSAGGVRRATSASSARTRATNRSSSSIAALSGVRCDYGNWGWDW